MDKHIDLGCVRTFVAIVEAGSFLEAANRVNRSLSAVSQQMERLQSQLGTDLFQSAGRRRVLTASGEVFLIHARSLLAENDAVLNAMSNPPLTGTARFGCVQDFAEAGLPLALSKFKTMYPDIRLNVTVSSSDDLSRMVENSKIDLAVRAINPERRPIDPLVWRAMTWIGHVDFKTAGLASVPLVVFGPHCPFRRAMIEALEAQQQAWHVAFESPSLSGLKAAVQAGLGITARTTSFLEADLRPFSQADGLAPLPEISYGLDQASATPKAEVQALTSFLAESLTQL